jgi:hypothetical protein
MRIKRRLVPGAFNRRSWYEHLIRTRWSNFYEPPLSTDDEARRLEKQRLARDRRATFARLRLELDKSEQFFKWMCAVLEKMVSPSEESPETEIQSSVTNSECKDKRRISIIDGVDSK